MILLPNKDRLRYLGTQFFIIIVIFIIQAVESVLLDLHMVNACVVMVMGDEGHDRFLVAYIVPEGKVRKKDVRAELKKRLPFYMIPSYFMLLSRYASYFIF